MSDEGGTPEVNSIPEERLEGLISNVGLSLFPSDVQDEVEKILAPGQALEPEARARLVAAAKRAGRHVALTHAAIEVLLFTERRERHQEAEDVAGIVGIDADSIRAIERGERSIDTEDARGIAVWACALGLDRVIVNEALRKSLGTPTGAASYAGSRKLRLTTDQEDFIHRVLEAFDERNNSAAAE